LHHVDIDHGVLRHFLWNGNQEIGGHASAKWEFRIEYASASLSILLVGMLWLVDTVGDGAIRGRGVHMRIAKLNFANPLYGSALVFQKERSLLFASGLCHKPLVGCGSIESPLLPSSRQR
jgi:hypothetical protein